MVCGLFGIAALILGNQSKEEIAASGGTQTGEGMAKAGVILGWISIAFMIIGVVIFILLLATGAFAASTSTSY